MNYIQFVKKYMTENPSFRNNHRTLRSAMMSEEAKKEYGKSVKHKRKATKGKRMKAPVEAPKVKDDKKCPPPCPPVVVNVTCPGGNVTSSAPVYHRHQPQQGTEQLQTKRNIFDESTDDGSSDEERTVRADSAEYLNGTPNSNNISKIYNSNDTPKNMSTGLFDNPLWLKQQELRNLREAKVVDKKVSPGPTAPSAPNDVPVKAPSAPELPVETVETGTSPEPSAPDDPDDVPVKTVESGTSPEPMEDYGTAESKLLMSSKTALADAKSASKDADDYARVTGKLVGALKDKYEYRNKVEALENGNQLLLQSGENFKNSQLSLSNTISQLRDNLSFSSENEARLENSLDAMHNQLRSEKAKSAELNLTLSNLQSNADAIGKILYDSGISSYTYSKLTPQELLRGIGDLLRMKEQSEKEAQSIRRQLARRESSEGNILRLENGYNETLRLLNHEKAEKSKINQELLAIKDAYATFEMKQNNKAQNEKALIVQNADKIHKDLENEIKRLKEELEKRNDPGDYDGEVPAISSYVDKMPLKELVSNDAVKDLTVEQADSILEQLSMLGEEVGLAARINQLPDGKQEKVNLLRELGNKKEYENIPLIVDVGKTKENLDRRRKKRKIGT